MLLILCFFFIVIFHTIRHFKNLSAIPTAVVLIYSFLFLRLIISIIFWIKSFSFCFYLIKILDYIKKRNYYLRFKKYFVCYKFII